MSGKRILGRVLICLGVLFFAGALGLLVYNMQEARAAESSAQEVMVQLGESIREQALSETPLPRHVFQEETVTVEGDEENSDETITPIIEEMPVVEIDGYFYIGFLTIPDLGLELPIMELWDYDRLKIAPCRYSGTLAGGNLVIAAHNYLRHFGTLSQLKQGAEVLFTDAEGEVTHFVVEDLEILGARDIHEMTAGDYPLTLFTCTYRGRTRFTVRCSIVTE